MRSPSGNPPVEHPDLSMRGKLCKIIGNFMYHVISASVRKFGTDPDQETKTKATQAHVHSHIVHVSHVTVTTSTRIDQNWVLRLAVLLPIETRNCWQLLGCVDSELPWTKLPRQSRIIKTCFISTSILNLLFRVLDLELPKLSLEQNRSHK